MGILTSTRYPEEIKGQHIPMITQQQFYRVQAILDGRNTNIAVTIARRNNDNDEFPLRKIVNCGKCGTPFTEAWTKGRNSKYALLFLQK